MNAVQSSWPSAVRNVWKIDPAIAVHMSERFNAGTLQTEVTRLVRSNTRDVLDVPEALRFLIGENLDTNIKRDLKVDIALALQQTGA
jgi:phosphatidylinositol 4-kinase A